MTKSIRKLGRATRAFTAALAIVGAPAALAGVQTARAFDAPATSAASGDDPQGARQGYAIAPRPRPYASARRDRRIENPPATDFQDIK